MAAREADGADYIKVLLEDLGGTVPTLDRATAEAVVRAAHARGKVAIAHAPARVAMEAAVAAGADGLAHTIDDAPLPPALLAAIAARGLFVIPTLTILELRCGLGGGATLAEDRHIAPYLDPDAAAALRAGPWGSRAPTATGAAPRRRCARCGRRGCRSWPARTRPCSAGASTGRRCTASSSSSSTPG